MTSVEKKWIRIDESSIYKPQGTDDEKKWPEIRFISYGCSRFDNFFDGNRFPNLTVLLCVDLHLKDIQHLSALSACPNLYLINCSHNEITSLQGIEALQNIKFFYCNDNLISDLSPLSSLVSLTILECQSNCLGNLNGLEFCPNLQMVKCGNNPFISQAIAQGTLEKTIQEVRHQLSSSAILIEGL